MTTPTVAEAAAQLLRDTMHDHALDEPFLVLESVAPTFRAVLGLPAREHPDYQRAPKRLREAAETVDTWMDEIITHSRKQTDGDHDYTATSQSLLQAAMDSQLLDTILTGGLRTREWLLDAQDRTRICAALARRRLPGAPDLITMDLAVVLREVLCESQPDNPLGQQVHDLLFPLGLEWMTFMDVPVEEPCAHQP